MGGLEGPVSGDDRDLVFSPRLFEGARPGHQSHGAELQGDSGENLACLWGAEHKGICPALETAARMGYGGATGVGDERVCAGFV